jgi:hypothetical protein
MSVQIQEGRYYRSRAGHRYGPAVYLRGIVTLYPWLLRRCGNPEGEKIRVMNGGHRLDAATEHETDMVAEWVAEADTRMPGEYGLAYWQKAYANFRHQSAPWEQ